MRNENNIITQQQVNHQGESNALNMLTRYKLKESAAILSNKETFLKFIA